MQIVHLGQDASLGVRSSGVSASPPPTELNARGMSLFLPHSLLIVGLVARKRTEAITFVLMIVMAVTTVLVVVPFVQHLLRVRRCSPQCPHLIVSRFHNSLRKKRLLFQ